MSMIGLSSISLARLGGILLLRGGMRGGGFLSLLFLLVLLGLLAWALTRSGKHSV